MSSRDFDILVFGASGFTGYFVCELLAKLQLSNQRSFTFAIAGRSQSKLADVIKRIRSAHPDFQKDITTFANVDVKHSPLETLTSRAHVVISCVGPYRFFGEPVVRACHATKTDYVDITGEPEFMERMENIFPPRLVRKDDPNDDEAIIISACGFDSIPAEFGTNWARDVMRKDNVTCTVIDSFIRAGSSKSGGGGHYTTFESAVYGVGSMRDLAKVRKDFVKSHSSFVKHPKFGYPEPMKKLTTSPLGYGIIFPGSDAAVVRRSQRLVNALNEQEGKIDVSNGVPLTYHAYFAVKSALNVAIFMVFGIIFFLMSSNPVGRRLLLNNPKFFTMGHFTHEGPTAEQRANSSFSMTLYAKGYSDSYPPESFKIADPTKNLNANGDPIPHPDSAAVVRVSGPEPGYISTPIFVVSAALSLLQDRSKVRCRGVVPPGFALYTTSFKDTCTSLGIKFEVLEAPHPIST